MTTVGGPTMRRVTVCLKALVPLFVAGCLQVEEPEEPALPEELPSQIVFSESNLPAAVELSDEMLQTAKKSVVADFNLDGLEDVAIVEEVDEGAAPAAPANGGTKQPKVAPLKAPEVTVYIRSKPKKGGSVVGGNLYHKAGVIPSVLGKTVKGIASRKTREYTDLVILFKEDSGTTEMVHYQNKGDRFIKIEDVQTEPAPAPSP